MSVYDIVLERIIKNMEEGKIPWQKPWIEPINYVTRRKYTGINRLLLEKPGEYLTFNQVKKLNGKVKKGAKSNIVVFWKIEDPEENKNKENENGNEQTDEEIEQNEIEQKTQKKVILRYYKVFHIDDCEGIETKIKNQTEKSNNILHDIYRNYLKKEDIKLIEEGIEAYYSISQDKIVIPQKKYFKSDEEFLSTIYHEIVHSTGHAKRLNRFTEEKQTYKKFKEEYSFEELVAEIGSAFILGEHGIEKTIKNNTAYIQSWIKYLKDNKKAIIQASSMAQKAVEYITQYK